MRVPLILRWPPRCKIDRKSRPQRSFSICSIHYASECEKDLNASSLRAHHHLTPRVLLWTQHNWVGVEYFDDSFVIRSQFRSRELLVSIFENSTRHWVYLRLGWRNDKDIVRCGILKKMCRVQRESWSKFEHDFRGFGHLRIQSGVLGVWSHQEPLRARGN